MTTISKYNPSTGEHLADYESTSVEGVHDAVAKARTAFGWWSQLSVTQRLERVDAIRKVVKEGGEEFARRISEDTGKPKLDSLMTELLSIPLFIDYYAKTAEKTLSRKKIRTPIVFAGKSSYVEHFPMGVVAVIAPWNFPFQLSMVPIVSALIAGNTVVLKPSEVTPGTGEVIRDILAAANLSDVAIVVQGDGKTGAALCESDVDKIFFTGSVATGRKVMMAAAKKPIPVELELGGKDAFIVCHDADLERASRACAWGGLMNCGQMCTSVERVFVVDEIYDAFLKKLKKQVEATTFGGPDEDADIGPMTFPKQIKTVERHLKNAVKDGATILVGGERADRPGDFFLPTLIVDVTPEMEIYVEETFGPVLPVIRVRSEEEAVRLANDHQYGLSGSVWTKDKKRGKRLAQQMKSGQVMVNDVVVGAGNPAIPFGGVKASGIGRYHGEEGLLTFVHTKGVMVDQGLFKSEPYWFPYRGKYPPMLKAYKALLNGNLPKAVKNLITLRK